MANVSASFDLSGKTAVITGGAGLLGRQFSQTLAEAGAALLVADMNDAVAEELAAEIRDNGGKAAAFKANVTDPNSTKEMVARAVEEFGSLDILVNSAFSSVII